VVVKDQDTADRLNRIHAINKLWRRLAYDPFDYCKGKREVPDFITDDSGKTLILRCGSWTLEDFYLSAQL